MTMTGGTPHEEVGGDRLAEVIAFPTPAQHQPNDLDPEPAAQRRRRPPGVTVHVPTPRRLPTDRQWASSCDTADAVIVQLRRAYPRARQLAADWRRGYPSSGGSSGGGHTGHADPTGSAAAAHVEGNAGPDVARALVEDLVVLEGLMATMQHLGARVLGAVSAVPAEDPDGVVVPMPSGQGACGACDRFVSGSSADRLRSGYCQACYRRWLRLGRPDRAAFEHDTRHQHHDEGGDGYYHPRVDDARHRFATQYRDAV